MQKVPDEMHLYQAFEESDIPACAADFAFSAQVQSPTGTTLIDVPWTANCPHDMIPMSESDIWVSWTLLASLARENLH